MSTNAGTGNGSGLEKLPPDVRRIIREMGVAAWSERAELAELKERVLAVLSDWEAVGSRASRQRYQEMLLRQAYALNAAAMEFIRYRMENGEQPLSVREARDVAALALAQIKALEPVMRTVLDAQVQIRDEDGDIVSSNIPGG